MIGAILAFSYSQQLAERGTGWGRVVDPGSVALVAAFTRDTSSVAPVRATGTTLRVEPARGDCPLTHGFAADCGQPRDPGGRQVLSACPRLKRQTGRPQ